MITQIIKFLRVLGSEADPIQISLAIALAMIAAFTPLLSLHNLVVVFILLAFRINLAAFLLALTVLSGVAYLLDPVFHSLGLSLLQNEAMQATWIDMYNSTFWRVTHFNNTVLIGGLVISLIAFIPVVLIMNIFIHRYREHILVYLMKSKLMTYLQNSKMFTRFTSAME